MQQRVEARSADGDRGRHGLPAPASATLSIWRDRFSFTSKQVVGAQMSSCRPAIVLQVALRGAVTIETARARRTGRIVAVDANAERTLVSSTGGIYVLHLDPADRRSRWLRSTAFADTDIVALPDHIDRETARLIVDQIDRGAADTSGTSGTPPLAHSRDVSQRLLDGLFPGASSAQPIDARVARVVGWLWTHLPARMDLPLLAELCGLSESHLDHLFTRSIGVSIRQYLLWLKMRKAAEMFGRDVRLAEIAHAVGFSDSAHLSRTFVRYFGVMPSFLANRRQVHVQVERAPG